MGSFENWLVGFIEAEGSFSTNRGRYPVFSLSQGDEQDFLKNMRDFFGEGTVWQSKPSVWTYSVYGRGCWPIRVLCDGNLRLTKRVAQFEHWKGLRWPNQVVPSSFTLSEPSFEDWLIGFIEGEGTFTKTSACYPEFSLHQDESYDTLMQIRGFLGIGKVEKHLGGCQYRVAGRDCWVVRNFCENKLRLPKRVRQFEQWKSELRWLEPPTFIANKLNPLQAKVRLL